MRKIEPGQIWEDVNKVWSSDNINAVYLVLSLNIEYSNEKDVWTLAWFWWFGGGFKNDGYGGARIREFYEEDINRMKYVGNIRKIKKF